ncbi:MAG: hypothetical protein ACO21J_02630 [Anaerohalosphaeraceae bacterium]
MIREDLDKDSRIACIDIFPDGQVEMGARPVKGEEAWMKVVMGPETPGIQLKLVHKGTFIERYFARGGSDRDKLGTVESKDLPNTVYAGLFSPRHDNTTRATSKFREIKLESN